MSQNRRRSLSRPPRKQLPAMSGRTTDCACTHNTAHQVQYCVAPLSCVCAIKAALQRLLPPRCACASHHVRFGSRRLHRDTSPTQSLVAAAGCGSLRRRRALRRRWHGVKRSPLFGLGQRSGFVSRPCFRSNCTHKKVAKNRSIFLRQCLKVCLARAA